MGLTTGTRCLAAGALMAAVALAPACRAQEVASPSPEWNALVADFETAFMQANPTFAVYQGRHEFDGRLPDWGAEGIARWIASLRAWREKTDGFDEESPSSSPSGCSRTKHSRTPAPRASRPPAEPSTPGISTTRSAS